MQKIKGFGDECRISLRQARSSQSDTLKKLQKILPKDSLKQLEDFIDKELKKAEKDCDTLLKKK